MASRLQDFLVGFSSKIEAPDRFFEWGRGRSRVKSEARLEYGSATARAPVVEEFTYPVPTDPEIRDMEITIENDPELQITGFKVRLFNASSDIFVPAGVSVKPEMRLQCRWTEEHAQFALKGAGGMKLTFVICTTRSAQLGFWATHFDELHQEKKSILNSF
jgi:hypothetical protein